MMESRIDLNRTRINSESDQNPFWFGLNECLSVLTLLSDIVMIDLRQIRLSTTKWRMSKILAENRL